MVVFDDFRFFSTTFYYMSLLISSLPFSLVNPLSWFVGVEGAISLGLRHQMSQRPVRYCPNCSFSGPLWTPAGRAGPSPGKSNFGRLSQTFHFSIYSLYEIGTFGLRRLSGSFGGSGPVLPGPGLPGSARCLAGLGLGAWAGAWAWAWAWVWVWVSAWDLMGCRR